MSRDAIVRPHADAHEDSIRRQMKNAGVMPRGLQALLRWFLAEWADEVPMRLHGAGQERMPPGSIVRSDLTVVKDPGGPDRTGAPRHSDEWRRYVENSDRETNADGSYVRPMHAALSMLAGRSRDGAYPFMARYLMSVAFANGDWEHVAARQGVPAAVAVVYTEEALRRLWVRYDSRIRETAVA